MPRERIFPRTYEWWIWSKVTLYLFDFFLDSSWQDGCIYIYSYGTKWKKIALRCAFEDPSQLNQRVVKTRKDRNLWRMNRQGAIDRSETRDWARAIRVSRGLLMRLRCPLSPSFPLSKVIITRRKLVFAREARRKTEDCLPRPNRTGFQLRESAAAGSSVHNKFYYRLHRSQFTRHLNDVLMRPT